jgi:membrane AbrB-like protein
MVWFKRTNPWFMGALFGGWLQRQHAVDFEHMPRGAGRATCYFASAIGGASEMTLLSERHGARTDLVAASHSVRLVIVVLSVPFAMQWVQSHWGLTVDTRLLPGAAAVDGLGLLGLALATAGGALVMAAFKRANPWFMGALLASMGLTLAGLEWSTIPTFLSNAAQLVIGVSLGVRFRREFMHTAPRWLFSVALGTLGMLVLSAVFGQCLAWATGLQATTLILGTAPGGIAEMAITAKVLQLGVPVVTAFQVCRLVAVLVLVGPMFQWLGTRQKTT